MMRRAFILFVVGIVAPWATQAGKAPFSLQKPLTARLGSATTLGPVTEDAGDVYRLPDGSLVHLRRAHGEVAVRFVGERERKLGLPGGKRLLRTRGLTEIWRGQDLKSAAGLPAVATAFPVLVEPKSRTRLIPTDEILVRLVAGT